jgi:hypothetical protein
MSIDEALKTIREALILAPWRNVPYPNDDEQYRSHPLGRVTPGFYAPCSARYSSQDQQATIRVNGVEETFSSMEEADKRLMELGATLLDDKGLAVSADPAYAAQVEAWEQSDREAREFGS